MIYTKYFLRNNRKILYIVMSINLSTLKDRPSDFSRLLSSTDLNASFASSLDSDIDTQDAELNAELMSPLYSNYDEIPINTPS